VRPFATAFAAAAIIGPAAAPGPAALPGPALRQAPLRAALPLYGYSVVNVYPHDPGAFTQGLEYLDGVLYEGTGQHGESSIRKVRLETGEVLQRRDVPRQYFGEGITIWRTSLFQLTWQSGVAFEYHRDTFLPRRTFKYAGEGWGLTHDADGLVMSDGTDILRFLDPETFAERRRVRVSALGRPVGNLNELEFVKGELFANLWQTDILARIDATSGRVTGWVDLRGLLRPGERLGTDVLNGIAYDAPRDRLFVTGKLWPKLFEIRLVPRPL